MAPDELAGAGGLPLPSVFAKVEERREMPYCPECHAEFREGVGECASCAVPLVAERPGRDPFASARGMAQMLEGETLRAAFLGGPTGLAELREMLAERRIPSVIAPPQEGCSTTCKPRLMLLLRGEDVGPAQEAFESSFDAEHRSELVQPIDAGDPGGEEEEEAPLTECPACGTPRSSADEQECPECGLFLG